jgi:hypothetical protein
MKLTLKNLEYPGLFAHIGNIGYVEIYQIDRVEETTLKLNGANENGIPFDQKTYNSIDELLKENTYLNSLKFTKKNNKSRIKIFDEIEKELSENNIKVKLSTQFWRADKINKVKLYFSNKIWSDLFDADGDLLPICCASISEIRDCFIEAKRSSGWMQIDDIVNITNNSISHEFEENHPVSIIKKIYNKIFLYMDEIHSLGTKNVDNIEDACDLLTKFSYEFVYQSFLTGFSDIQTKANLNYSIYSIVPAINTLYNKLQKLRLSPIEGYALINLATNKVYTMSSGLSIFPTVEEAEKIKSYWLEVKQIHDSKECEIRKVRITIEKGIEFI